ncbi:hypothetical protein WICPIJ_008351 [Wickerhamomyces pijperi]|uniref:Uncharacterized protein n=1 Tax=Wickerhamomyces pijperi TaxID=599730 RepID=A0A9P8PZ32_WICPI|nr:hypothetical protein WICPIJ_008351 [Wickerhamomyces pijperi]
MSFRALPVRYLAEVRKSSKSSILELIGLINSTYVSELEFKLVRSSFARALAIVDLEQPDGPENTRILGVVSGWLVLSSIVHLCCYCCWLLMMALIAGETLKFFALIVAGRYAVVVTQDKVAVESGFGFGFGSGSGSGSGSGCDLD